MIPDSLIYTLLIFSKLSSLSLSSLILSFFSKVYFLSNSDFMATEIPKIMRVCNFGMKTFVGISSTSRIYEAILDGLSNSLELPPKAINISHKISPENERKR